MEAFCYSKFPRSKLSMPRVDLNHKEFRRVPVGFFGDSATEIPDGFTYAGFCACDKCDVKIDYVTCKGCASVINKTRKHMAAHKRICTGPVKKTNKKAVKKTNKKAVVEK